MEHIFIEFFTPSQYLSQFETDADIPLSDIAESSFDADDENSVDLRSDPRLDFFDRAEFMDVPAIAPSTHIEVNNQEPPESATQPTENQ